MSTKKEKGKGTFSVVIVVILSVLLVILGFSIFTGLLKGYRGDRKATESDMYGISRGLYEEIAYTYQRTMFNNDNVSSDVKKGLAVGEYFHAAMIEAAHEKLGNPNERIIEEMKDCKDRMGDYDVVADRIDEDIKKALKKAWE